jgi:hypothetical protein
VASPFPSFAASGVIATSQLALQHLSSEGMYQERDVKGGGSEQGVLPFWGKEAA